jgi:predicted TIM-barrel fold metal-dependent hydrolase
MQVTAEPTTLTETGERVPVIQHPAPDPAWLSRRSEPVIEPAMPIIDPHHHLWDRGGGYFLDELLADIQSGHTIVSTVFLQCAHGYRTEGPEALKAVGETEFVVALAREADARGVKARVCEGIVGFADMLLGDAVTPVLEAHMAAADGRFRGIRHVTARNEAFRASIVPPPPAHAMADDAFRTAYARLRAHDLSFDAWLYHTQIDELAVLARAFPDTPVILNHVGGPLGIGPYAGKRDDVFADWRAALGRLARCSNVSVKLGGLAMVITGFEFHKQKEPPGSEVLLAAWHPYLDTCIEAFGPARCMFESNFPVDKAMCSYTAMWNTFKRAVASHSVTDKAAMFHDTAARVYRLKS